MIDSIRVKLDIAELYLKQGRGKETVPEEVLGKVEDYSHQAWEEASKIGNDVLRYKSLFNLGEALCLRKDYSAGKENYREAIKIAEKIGALPEELEEMKKIEKETEEKIDQQLN